MKIALCFFGRTYGFQTDYVSLHSGKSKKKKVRFLDGLDTIRKNVMQEHDIDVYCHAWIDKSNKEGDLCIHLNPKDLVAEEQKIFSNDVIGQGVLSQFYSRSQSLKMAFSPEEKYDLIVAIRYDVVFFNPVEYEKVQQDILYTDGDVHTRDWHIVGSPDIMKKIIPMFEFGKENIDLIIGHDRPQANIYNLFYKINKIKRKTLLRYDNKKGLEPSLYNINNVSDHIDFGLARSIK
jgi:hypothetical protein